MDMELVMRDLQIEKEPLRAKALAQAEGDLTPPSSLPPIARLLGVDARASASGTPIDGRLMVEGAVTLSVLYACSAGSVHAFESVAAFKHGVDLDVTSQSQSSVTAVVGAIETKVTDGAVHIKAIVEIDCAAGVRATLPVVESICCSRIESRQREASPELIDVTFEEYCIREDARLPRLAQTLLGVNGSTRVQSVIIEGSKAVIEGCVSGYAAFRTPEGDIVHSPINLPFEQRMLLPEGAVRAFAAARVVSLRAELAADDIAAVECTFEIALHSACAQQCMLLDDAYSLDEQLVLQRAVVPMMTRECVNACVPLRLTVEVPSSMPPVDKALLCTMRAHVEDCDAQDGTVAVRGIIYAFVTYRCSAGELYGFSCKLPFATAFDVPVARAGMPVVLRADCEWVSSGTGRQMPLQLTLNTVGEIFRTTEVSVITDVERRERENPFTGLAVYYPARGETLWDVGKRFGVTQDQLRTLGADTSCEKPILINVRAC